MAKFSQKLADSLCEALAQSGCVTSSCEVVGINFSSYYRWLQKYPKFKQQVEEAKRKYSDPERFLRHRKLAQDRLEEYLQYGVIETTTITETKRDRDGEIVSTNIREMRTQKPCPSWVISRFIAPAEPELQHITKLMDIGAIPIEFVELVHNHLEEFGKKLEAVTDTTSPLLKGKIEDDETSNNLDDFLERLKRTGGDDNA